MSPRLVCQRLDGLLSKMAFLFFPITDIAYDFRRPLIYCFILTK